MNLIPSVITQFALGGAFLAALIFVGKKLTSKTIDHIFKKTLEAVKADLADLRAFNEKLGTKKGELYPVLAEQCHRVRNLCRDLFINLRDNGKFDENGFHRLSDELIKLTNSVYGSYALLSNIYPIVHEIKRKGNEFFINFDALSFLHASTVKRYQFMLKIPKRNIHPKDAPAEIERFENSRQHMLNKLGSLDTEFKKREMDELASALSGFRLIFDDRFLLEDVTRYIQKENYALECAIALALNKYIKVAERIEDAYLSKVTGRELDMIAKDWIGGLVGDIQTAAEQGNFVALENEFWKLPISGVENRSHLPLTRSARIFLYDDKFLDIYDKLAEAYKEIEANFELLKKKTMTAHVK